jgi:hypothetical protein
LKKNRKKKGKPQTDTAEILVDLPDLRRPRYVNSSIKRERETFSTFDNEGKQKKRKYDPNKIHDLDSDVEFISTTNKNVASAIEKNRKKKGKTQTDTAEVLVDLPDLHSPKSVHSSTKRERKTLSSFYMYNEEIHDLDSDVEFISTTSKNAASTRKKNRKKKDKTEKDRQKSLRSSKIFIDHSLFIPLQNVTSH